MSERYRTIIRDYLGSYNLAPPVLPETNTETAEKVKLLLLKTKKHSITFSLQGDNIKGNKRIYPISHTIKIIEILSKEFEIDFYLPGTNIFYAQVEYTKNILPALDIHNCCMKTSLADLKAVFEQTDLLIVDTGTIHIAATTKTNIIGLYGATINNSLPVNHRSILLYTHKSCSPCHYTRTVLNIPCPFGDKPKCMENITSEAVVIAAREVLTYKS
jgi:ADP-heptose:LPS heptosyltransferase